MSETKFTPGPWSYRPTKYDDWGVVRSGEDFICQAKNPIVSYSDLDGYRANKTDPYEANARLIAAAPELYEALQRCLAYIERDELAHGRQFGEGNEARSALAKASGAS